MEYSPHFRLIFLWILDSTLSPRPKNSRLLNALADFGSRSEENKLFDKADMRVFNNFQSSACYSLTNDVLLNICAQLLYIIFDETPQQQVFFAATWSKF